MVTSLLQRFRPDASSLMGMTKGKAQYPNAGVPLASWLATGGIERFAGRPPFTAFCVCGLPRMQAAAARR